ncbi:MAG: diguanylate cyclase [Candidatus Moranbacteria bacterium]|nr:diguanylate cyclase [Candidatus Moranbacteria bacterium]
MNWWLTKSSIFKELTTSIVGITASALIFGLFGVYIDSLMKESITRFVVWTAIGSLIFRFMFSMSTAIAEEYERVKALSIYDTLTGLNNRGYIPEAVTLTFAHAQRAMENFCIFSLDGNDIKAINDVYGHSTGDKAIKKIAKRIQEVVYRRNDIIVRPSGDEFTILCASKDPQKMYARMVEELNKKEIFIETENTQTNLSISVAVGMAFMPTTLEAIREKTPHDLYHILYAEADKKMYENKQAMKKVK